VNQDHETMGKGRRWGSRCVLLFIVVLFCRSFLSVFFVGLFCRSLLLVSFVGLFAHMSRVKKTR